MRAKPVAHPESIRAALVRYLDECAERGILPGETTHMFYRVVRERLRISYAGMTRWEEHDTENRFRYQVLRALDKLAADGLLVRHGERRSLRFLTPAASAALEASEAEARRLKEERLARAKDIAGRLYALDLDVLVNSGVPVRLDPGDWEKLLDLAEAGREARETVKTGKEG
jgi:hypothetical protein